MTGDVSLLRAPRPLLPRQEKFAQLLAAGGDAVTAYRATHRNKGGTRSPRTQEQRTPSRSPPGHSPAACRNSRLLRPGTPRRP